jgi:magnesium-transporting ATPase (P-type)
LLSKVRGSDVACDESALTGESDEVKKDTKKTPFMLSGTSVMKGTGLMLVTCVGLFSEEGIIQKLITNVGEEEV